MKTYQWRVITTDVKKGYFKAQYRVLRSFPWFWTTLGGDFIDSQLGHYDHIYESVPEAESAVQRHIKSLKTKEEKFKARVVSKGCIDR